MSYQQFDLHKCPDYFYSLENRIKPQLYYDFNIMKLIPIVLWTIILLLSLTLTILIFSFITVNTLDNFEPPSNWMSEAILVEL